MFKLPVKHQKRLVSLINGIETAHIMVNQAKTDEVRKLWQNQIKTNTLNLANEYGIKLPALEIYLK